MGLLLFAKRSGLCAKLQAAFDTDHQEDVEEPLVRLVIADGIVKEAREFVRGIAMKALGADIAEDVGPGP